MSDGRLSNLPGSAARAVQLQSSVKNLMKKDGKASGLAEKDKEAQVNTLAALVYSVGDEADDILRSFGLSEDDAKRYDVVKGKFGGYFIKR